MSILHCVWLLFWLAKSVAERSVANIELPWEFGAAIRKEVGVDAPAVDLGACYAQYIALDVYFAHLLCPCKRPKVSSLRPSRDAGT